MTTLTPKQHLFLQKCYLNGFHFASGFVSTAKALERRKLVKLVRRPSVVFGHYEITDAGKAALKEIGE